MAAQDFQSDVRTDYEGDIEATIARFTVDAKTAKEIRELAELVKARDLHKVEKFDYRTEWLNEEEEDVATDADCLNVSQTEFWFTAYEKHGSIEMLTQRFRIADLTV